MDSIKDVLKTFNPTKDRYISREYQSFGVHLAEKLEDERHKALYIRLAKQLPRPVLHKALQFVVDSGARRKGALFMWKLKELGAWPAELTKKGASTKTTKSSSKKRSLKTTVPDAIQGSILEQD
ncbi:MAG: hypothetical protein UZ22_OP11002000418 [Microgenomates bacterium OLB23]|nr:MAG: hypothetical protein UZ22_OP11002000418 [Microgenomates bacterium OLB23]